MKILSLDVFFYDDKLPVKTEWVYIVRPLLLCLLPYLQIRGNLKIVSFRLLCCQATSAGQEQGSGLELWGLLGNFEPLSLLH